MVEGRGGSDGARARAWAYRRSRRFRRSDRRAGRGDGRHLGRQIESGAEAVQLFDSWAGLLPADEFRRWVIAPTAAIVDRLRAGHPGVPVIGFPRGAGVLYASTSDATGVEAVGLDAGGAGGVGETACSGHCAVQGNLDNQLLRPAVPAC